LPLGAISNRTTVFCNETGEYIVYRSDEHGFHNPAGIWGTQPLHVLALGDSFTQGGCVSSDKNFVASLRRRYPGTLNLGLAGHGPLSMLAVLKETLPATGPKVVLWFYFEESDPIDLSRERKSALLLRYLQEDFSQNLLSRQGAIDAALKDYAEKEQAKELSTRSEVDLQQALAEMKAKLTGIMKLPMLRRRLGLVAGSQQTVPGAEDNLALQMPPEHLRLFGEILSKAREAVSRFEGRLYFVYLPAWERYGHPANARKDRDQVLSLVKSLDIPVIDVHPAFESQGDPLSLFPFRRFGHYNEQGHALVAETVLADLSVDERTGGSQ
jgi:hypothetical protein